MAELRFEHTHDPDDTCADCGNVGVDVFAPGIEESWFRCLNQEPRPLCYACRCRLWNDAVTATKVMRALG